MHTEKEISWLLEKAKHTSTIRFLPYISDPPREVAEVNIALQQTESEEKRWKLFLALLRSTRTGEGRNLDKSSLDSARCGGVTNLLSF